MPYVLLYKLQSIIFFIPSLKININHNIMDHK